MIYQAVKHLFPGIRDGEFSLQDDGEGPYIARWSRPEPQPTMEELDAAIASLPTFDQPAALQRLRDVRSLILNALSGVGVDAVAANDSATLAGVAIARQGLKDAPKDAAILAATSDASFDLAAKLLYARLVMAAPATVRAAFKDVQ